MAINLGKPVNLSHPLVKNYGLMMWLTCLPGGLRSSSTWFDVLGKYSGTMVNGAAQDRIRTGWAESIAFDGSNDRVTVSLPSLGTTFSIACWIRPNGQTDNYGMILGENVSTNGYFYHGSGAGANAGLMNITTSSARRSNTPLVDGAWNFTTVTLNTGSVTHYLNGISDGTPGAGVVSITPNIAGDDSGSDTFNGNMDCLMVFAGALSDSAVRSLYNESRMGFPTLLNRMGRGFTTTVSAPAGIAANPLLGGGTAASPLWGYVA